MKIKSLLTLGFIILHSAFCLSARAQGSSLNSFTYQGRLHDTNGAANGLYDFSFALFPDSTGGSQIGTTVSRGLVPVTNGLFTVPLEFLDANSFSGADRWLEIAVHPSGVGTNITLSPRQQITAAPYAIRAANLSGPLPLSQLPVGVVMNNGSGVTLAGTFTGNGAGLSNVNAATLGGLGSAGFWKTNGNAGANPTNGAFLGTTDNLPVEFKVNGQRALRLEPTPNGKPNIIGGSAVNSVAAEVFGVTISGGGNNRADTGASYATVGGGQYNVVGAGSGESTIGGGYRNTIETFDSTIGGGAVNTIETNSQYSTIAGGTANRILAGALLSTIGGGSGNLIESNAPYSAIPGGLLNTAGGPSSFAAGYRAKAMHQGSFVWADSTDADFASTGTNQFLIRARGGVGINNNNTGDAALAVGGNVNVEGIISANAISAASATTPSIFTPRIATSGNVPLELFVNGQRGLRLEPTGLADTVNVIGGSALNFVGAGVVGATIGGGGSGNNFGADLPNTVEGNFSTVSGGLNNKIHLNAKYSTIAGGAANRIEPDADASFIGGGNLNVIRTNAWYATVAGGGDNWIHANSANSTISGGEGNTIQSDTLRATIGGGKANYILTAADSAAIGGGFLNTIGTGAVYATVGGGLENTIEPTAIYATIPGGRLNRATNYAFAAGRRAKANRTGAFVWADSTDADFAATANNQFLVRAAGGVGLGTPNPQGSLHVYSVNNPTVVRVQSTGTPGFGRLEFVSNPQGDANEWRPGYIQSTDNGGFVGGLAFYVNGAGAGNKFGSNEVMRIVNGRVGIGTPIPVSALHVVGTVTATAFNPPSDRNLKENFATVSSREVLEKVAALPISRWNFKGDAATPHVGPMAQDFHAAFGLGTDDKHIATVDADGVALAAIQGLNQKVEERSQKLEAENAELKQRLEKLERLLNRENGGAK